MAELRADLRRLVASSVEVPPTVDNTRIPLIGPRAGIRGAEARARGGAKGYGHRDPLKQRRRRLEPMLRNN